MFKRVSIVSALLFIANITHGQVATPTSVIDSSLELGKPVVTVSGATGTSSKDQGETKSTRVEDSPAETSSTTVLSVATSSAETGDGAFGTSSTTTVSTTSLVIETEEGTETLSSKQDKDKIFDLVYGGFEEFIRITLGWQ